MVAAAVGVGTAVAGLAGSYMSSKAAGSASDAQVAAAQAGAAEQGRQFDALQKLLAPYVGAGTKSLTGQMDLTGLNGTGAQSAAIDALKASPQFTALLQAGNDNILANASATGGLRGGNTQAALAQFSPALLNQVIGDQYSRLGGLTSLGQNAAAGVGNAGMTTGANISALMQQAGAAQAGGLLASGAATQNGLNSIVGGFGTYAALSRGQNKIYQDPDGYVF